MLLGLTLLVLLSAPLGVFGSGPPAAVREFYTFGEGKTAVRLYTDYFCGPCSTLEPKLETLLIKLVKKKVIRITFIDVPFHKHSSLYARYFLYIVQPGLDFNRVTFARAMLFEAAKENISEKGKLEEYLTRKGLRFREFDAKPVFLSLEKLIKEDGIKATPTCVIYRGLKKEVYSGTSPIVKALENLK